MIDMLPIAGMIFSLLMVLVIGGFILLFPLSKRLGKLIELRLEERRAGGALPEQKLDALTEVVESLQVELERLSERQQFTERLLETGQGPANEPAEPDRDPARDPSRDPVRS